MSESKKSLGVILITIYSGFFGIVSLPVGCALTIFGQAPEVGLMGLFFGFGLTLLGISLIAAAYGLWTKQSWGRNFTAWLYMISIPLGVIAIFPIFPGQQMSLGNTVLQILGIAVDVVIVGYLARPNVRLEFERAEKSQSFEEYTRREPH